MTTLEVGGPVPVLDEATVRWQGDGIDAVEMAVLLRCADHLRQVLASDMWSDAGPRVLAAAGIAEAWDLVEVAFDAGVDPLSRLEDIGTIVHLAATSRQPDVLSRILERTGPAGATIDQFGTTPLGVAATVGWREGARLLVEAGAPVTMDVLLSAARSDGDGGLLDDLLAVAADEPGTLLSTSLARGSAAEVCGDPPDAGEPEVVRVRQVAEEAGACRAG